MKPVLERKIYLFPLLSGITQAGGFKVQIEVHINIEKLDLMLTGEKIKGTWSRSLRRSLVYAGIFLSGGDILIMEARRGVVYWKLFVVIIFLGGFLVSSCIRNKLIGVNDQRWPSSFSQLWWRKENLLKTRQKEHIFLFNKLPLVISIFQHVVTVFILRED